MPPDAPDLPELEPLEGPELPSAAELWPDAALSAALRRMEAAADRLLAEAFRSQWW